MDRSMIDAAAGGALVDKTPVAGRTLIANMAQNTQQFGSRSNAPIRGVHEVQSSSFEKKVDSKFEEVSTLLRQLDLGHDKSQPPPPHCGICAADSHYTDQCPQLRNRPKSFARIFSC